MNAIITAATGYTATDMAGFLCSIDRHCKNTKVFLIVYKQDRPNLAALRDKYEWLEFLPVQKKPKWSLVLFHPLAYYLNKTNYSAVNPLFQVMGRHPLNILYDRFFIALELVKSYRSSFSNVLLTDSRDVIFQKDPFSLIEGKLISGSEAMHIGRCPYNTRWIKGSYGEEVWRQMSDRRVVCAGITLGPVQAIEPYLKAMCDETWRYLPQLALGKASDQGFHNYLIFANKIACKVTDNQEGLIATLGYEQPDNIVKDSTNGLVQVYGKYPAIIHQYDRHPDLVDFFKDNFSLA